MEETGKRLIIFGIPTSNKELIDLAKAWVLISVAFAIILKSDEIGWFGASLISFGFVGSAFLAHEVAHKIVAQKYRCWAEFRSFDLMLFFAIATAFLGFVFASPGAVMIRGTLRPEKNGKISLAGPGANIAIALLLGILYIFADNIRNIIAFGFFVNSWLAVLNLLPIPSFDGAKVLAWSKPAYFTAIALSFILLALSYTAFSF